jgi:EmrB/QacA subfamily drug resistance transporter
VQADLATIHRRRWFTLATLCLSLVIIVMDNTILNVAIPSLVRDIGATNSQLQWIIDGYTLVFAGLLLTAGSLGDRFGRKRALRVGIVVFALGSVLSAMAGNPAQLIATRSLMGVGGALIMPSTLSILTNVFRDPRERGRAIAIWAGCAGVGVALGPVLGGLLLEHFAWHAVFWVNLPIAAAALIAGHFFVPESKDPTAPRLDPLGAGLSIIGLGSLLFAVIEGPSQGWTSDLVLGAFAVGLGGLVAFIVWELRCDHPMLDISFFRNRRFTAANMAITLVFFALMGSLFLLTQYWQFVQGYSPLEAGVRLLPHAAVMMVMSPLSARFVERFGTKKVVTTGLATIALALLALSMIEPGSSYLRVISNVCLMGLGMALVTAPATESVMGSLPREKAGVGSAVNDTTRQMGGAMGVAVIGSLVASVYAGQMTDVARTFGLDPAQASSAKESLGGALSVASGVGGDIAGYVSAVNDAFVQALSSGLLLAAAVVGATAVFTWRYLPARAHDAVEFQDAVESHDTVTADDTVEADDPVGAGRAESAGPALVELPDGAELTPTGRA